MNTHLLLGEHEHSLDPKGRVILPAKYRHLFTEAVVRAGEDECLLVSPYAEWVNEAEEVRALSPRRKDFRNYQSFFFSRSHVTKCDRNGRISLPENLRRRAGLVKDVIIVGAGTRLEIWDAAKWRAQAAATESAIEEIAERIDDLV